MNDQSTEQREKAVNETTPEEITTWVAVRLRTSSGFCSMPLLSPSAMLPKFESGAYGDFEDILRLVPNGMPEQLEADLTEIVNAADAGEMRQIARRAIDRLSEWNVPVAGVQAGSN